MITGRRSTDWLSREDAPPSEGERRAQDRRSLDRRAPRRPLDPLFAATLVNQVGAQEDKTPAPRAYQSPLGRPLCGALLNLRT